MAQLLRSRRSYDHRIREIVCQTGNPRIFQHLRIPRSTTASWLSRGCRSVVSLDWHHDIASVLDENEKLKRRAQRQTAIIRLLVVLLKLSGFRLDEQRLADKLDDEQYELLVSEAEVELRRFVMVDGSVRFDLPALIASPCRR